MRRAASTLFAIRGRSARRVDEDRLAVAPYVPEKTAASRQGAFLQAFAEGRSLPAQPTIQEIERYPAEWAALAPGDVEGCAALAHLLGQSYRFTAADIPHMRQALGLDRPAVEQAYKRLYAQPLSAIYAARLTPAERVQWVWASLASRLENLPPFWIVYSLTLAALIGPAVLALPIALAGVGPLGGVVILLVAGLLNLLTLLALGEVSARNGHVRYGPAFFGCLASDYLGRGGAFLLGVALLGMTVMLLLACYLGLSTTLAAATGAPPLVFAIVLLAVNLYFMLGKAREPGLAVVVVIGIFAVALLLALSGLALGRFNPANFALAAPAAGRPFDAARLSLVFGAALAAYFAHPRVTGAARLALRRDPSGKSLQRGLAAAVLTAVLLDCLWVLAVSGALAPGDLAGQALAGTPLTPLAQQAGPLASLLGCLFVALCLGFGSLQFSQALANQAREWLPVRASAGRRGRLWSGVLPAAIIFLYVAWQLASGRVRFSGLFWFPAVALPLAAGIFPMLMLAVSRRKSDLVPGGGAGWLGKTPVVWAVCLLYLAAMLLYGLLVWKDPLERVLILLAALMAAGLIVLLWRQGAFTQRLVIHLRLEGAPGERLSFSVIAGGQPLAARVSLQYRFQAEERLIDAAEGQIESFTELRRISFTLPANPGGRPAEIKVWTQQLMPDGSTGALPAWLIIGEQEWDLNKSGGEVIALLSGRATVVTVVFQ